jgi:predicted DCC family thiol-disulfide oxidoreductase YuxK
VSDPESVRPVLVFDGDCGICRRWVNYWRVLTGDRIEYLPYQQIADQHPDIPLAEFQRSIQLLESGGARYRGAEATYRVLAYAPGHGHWLWLYRHIPGYAPISEAAYDFLSQHRELLARLTNFLWGRELQPTTYDRVRWLFLRLLGCIYLAAFASLAVQIEGLIGSHGILPLEDHLAALRLRYGATAYYYFPTLFWWSADDTALIAVCLAGAGCAALLILNRYVLAALILSYVLYLSLLYGGQIFMAYQWDLLLLETGFLAIFLAGRSRIVIWLFRWLLFRFLFLAGIVKILSGDPTWDSLTALSYHFETQPLPTPLAWYLHHLPESVLIAGTALTLLIEIVLVFFVFAPRRLRFFAGWCIILFQIAILLTGNYNFFNLLTLCLCLFLFDDAALTHLLPRALARRLKPAPPPGQARRGATVIAGIIAIVIIAISANQFSRLFARQALPLAGEMEQALRPFMIVNPYGLFANMTTRRPEIIIEGSLDGTEWREYSFRYKPGDPLQRPPWNIPHQPRLDWQMWFAALGSAERNPWFGNLLLQLLQNSPPVIALLGSVPFPGHAPRYMRALLYEYRFTDFEERRRTNAWWQRHLIGAYHAPIRLADPDERLDYH